VNGVCAQKLTRLQAIMAERSGWRGQLTQIQCMHGWLREVEHILDRSSLQATGVSVSNETVGVQLDSWRERMNIHVTDGTLTSQQGECLTECLHVLTNLRPYLVQCYDRQDFPRTNNEMERSIRHLKTQYRRVSGRKNWNAYLLRYGRSVAYAVWWEQDLAHHVSLSQQAALIDRHRWREARRQTRLAQREQLTRFRFCHKRQALLAILELRWDSATQSVPLP
jgi:hypothetical protein